jgi:hypothetical protein
VRAAVCLILVAGCGSDPAKTADAATHLDGSGSADLTHITLASGWNVEVFRDLAPLLPYVDHQFVDGTEAYSNQVSAPFAISGTMGESLGIVGGRAILAVTATTFALHDFGHHAANTLPFPDLISAAVWKDNSIALSSSSANGGDGVFAIAADWTISSALVDNNVRDIALDSTGAFDSIGTPGLYIGDMSGVFRLAGDLKIVPSTDATSLVVVGNSILYVHRISDQSADLYQVTTGTHAQALLLHAAVIELGEGPTTAPLPGLGRSRRGAAGSGRPDRSVWFRRGRLDDARLHVVRRDGAPCRARAGRCDLCRGVESRPRNRPCAAVHAPVIAIQPTCPTYPV